MTAIPAAVDEFLSAYPPAVQQTALAARELVFQVAPRAIEQVDHPAHMLAYGLAATYKDMLCVIILQKEYVNFGFPRGAALPDPEGLLEGTGKRARHVKLRTAEEASNPALRALLEESLAQLHPRG